MMFSEATSGVARCRQQLFFNPACSWDSSLPNSLPGVCGRRNTLQHQKTEFLDCTWTLVDAVSNAVDCAVVSTVDTQQETCLAVLYAQTLFGFVDYWPHSNPGNGLTVLTARELRTSGWNEGYDSLYIFDFTVITQAGSCGSRTLLARCMRSIVLVSQSESHTLGCLTRSIWSCQ